MIYRSYKDLPPEILQDFKNIWPNFSPVEFSCPCCGEYYHDPFLLTMLQDARTISGIPFNMNSGHRCEIHNAIVGGVPLSTHLAIAYDIDAPGPERFRIRDSLLEAGFSTFGLYQTFIHTDPRPGRLWYGGERSKKLWTGRQS